MARPGPETQAKRRREQAKKEKRRAKEEKKALRKAGQLPAGTEDGTPAPAPVDALNAGITADPAKN